MFLTFRTKTQGPLIALLTTTYPLLAEALKRFQADIASAAGREVKGVSQKIGTTQFTVDAQLLTVTLKTDFNDDLSHLKHDLPEPVLQKMRTGEIEVYEAIPHNAELFRPRAGTTRKVQKNNDVVTFMVDHRRQDGETSIVLKATNQGTLSWDTTEKLVRGLQKIRSKGWRPEVAYGPPPRRRAWLFLNFATGGAGAIAVMVLAMMFLPVTQTRDVVATAAGGPTCTPDAPRCSLVFNVEGKIVTFEDVPRAVIPLLQGGTAHIMITQTRLRFTDFEMTEYSRSRNGELIAGIPAN